MPLSAVWFPFVQHKKEPKLCIGYLLHSFSFVFLNNNLCENISRIGLFIRYNIYYAFMSLCFSLLVEVLQVRDVIAMMTMWILMFGKQMLVFFLWVTDTY